jgi:hypothetical protein
MSSAGKPLHFDANLGDDDLDNASVDAWNRVHKPYCLLKSERRRAFYLLKRRWRPRAWLRALRANDTIGGGER